ncbi:MAG: hypothetical protein ACOX38_06850 [Bacillota bacterium]
MGDIALALRDLYDPLGPEEKAQFEAAVIFLLEQRDMRVLTSCAGYAACSKSKKRPQC